MHKLYFGWGFAPDPAGGAYGARPDPLLDLRGATSKGGGNERGEESPLLFSADLRPCPMT